MDTSTNTIEKQNTTHADQDSKSNEAEISEQANQYVSANSDQSQHQSDAIQVDNYLPEEFEEGASDNKPSVNDTSVMIEDEESNVDHFDESEPETVDDTSESEVNLSLKVRGAIDNDEKQAEIYLEKIINTSKEYGNAEEQTIASVKKKEMLSRELVGHIYNFNRCGSLKSRRIHSKRAFYTRNLKDTGICQAIFYYCWIAAELATTFGVIPSEEVTPSLLAISKQKEKYRLLIWSSALGKSIGKTPTYDAILAAIAEMKTESKFATNQAEFHTRWSQLINGLSMSEVQTLNRDVVHRIAEFKKDFLGVFTLSKDELETLKEMLCEKLTIEMGTISTVETLDIQH